MSLKKKKKKRCQLNKVGFTIMFCRKLLVMLSMGYF